MLHMLIMANEAAEIGGSASQTEAVVSVCSTLAPIWQIIGWVLWVFKIVIPIIIIIFGMLDLGKAVVASKDDEIKKSVKQLALRAVAGIIIFFIPLLVGAVFNLVGDFKNEPYKIEYGKCKTCIVHPGSDACDGYVEEAES